MQRIFATLALAAAAFTSTMAHGQDVPDRLCGYIEFPWRYSEAQGHYYHVTPQFAKRGRPYGSLDVTQAHSIVPAPSADLNGDSQVVVSYRSVSQPQITMTPMPCGSEAPPSDGYVCAATTGLERIDGAYYDRHGMRFDDEEQIEHFWELEDAYDDAHPDTMRARRECRDYARADYPGISGRGPIVRGGYAGTHMGRAHFDSNPLRFYCVAVAWVKGEWGYDGPFVERWSSGLHNLGRHPFQGTLQGARFGFGSGGRQWLTFYETQDNCPTLPANGD